MTPEEQIAADEAAAAEAAAAAAAAAAPAADAPKAKTTAVRVLVDCVYGKANDVASLNAGDLKSAEAGGLVDAAPAAVKYARSLKAAGKAAETDQ